MDSPVDQVIAGYIALRNAKEAMDKRHKEEKAPLTAKMEKLEAWLQQTLQRMGTTSIKAAGIGTAYIETKTDASVQDWDAIFTWIKETGAFEFLERRVSKSVVQDYVKEHGAVPPGIQITQEIRTRIRADSAG